MGMYGCNWVQGHGGTVKQGKTRSKWTIVAYFTPLWPEKFPRTSCFELFDKKRCGWVQMDKKRVIWVRMDPKTRGKAKTRGKEPQH